MRRFPRDRATASKIGAQAIEMRAKTQAGFYYAEQTLRQLQRQNGGKLPLCEIVDAPVFAHRGFMLDCVRHFSRSPI